MHYNSNLKLNPTTESSSSLSIQYDTSNQLAWYYMNEKPRPCFTANLIEEIRLGFTEIMEQKVTGVEYIALCSSVPGTFNLGGDLNLFKALVLEKDREALLEYALASIVPLYLFHTGLGRNITTISLVQGDALGAGFEAALSADVLIAEKGARMGLPEVVFNMFPGMGAYSFISRKVSMALADEMVLGGKLYTSEELHDMGIVDILIDPGTGEKAVYNHIKKEERSKNTYQAIRKAKRCCNPVTFEELTSIVHVWVDAILELRDKDLRMMERLIKRQSSKFSE